MSTSGIVSPSYSKRNPQSQRSKQRRPRPHGKPQPTRYRPPSRPQPTRYALDMGRNISLLLTLARHGIRPNAATLAKCGGAE